jgi:monoamine oxidase
LVAIYGGSDYSKDIETLHDKEVVAGCMEVLKKIFSKATSDCRLTRSQINDLTVPDWPIDYFVSRWGSDPYSRGSFSYIPQGVDGLEELKAMSQPVCDFRPELNDTPRRPLILFAGEGTTPFHPSTIHGAFETGIREGMVLLF